jgi:rubrerythrin
VPGTTRKTGPMPGPSPRSLLREANPSVYGEALVVVGRPDVALSDLGTGSNLRVEWQCAACGERWQATPAARARGGGCPQCAWTRRARSRAQAPPGRSVVYLFPEVAAEFVANLDRPDMSPDDLRTSSQQRCVWRCAKCSVEWEATVANRTGGRGCVTCANLRRAVSRRRPTEASGTAAGRAWFPLVELQENLTNPGLGLEDLKPNSIDRCAWACSACGHRWEATVVNRIAKHSGCPVCSALEAGERRSTAPRDASLLALHPEIASQLVENLSVPDRTSAQIWPGSNAMCRWRCVRGHEWITTPASRVAGAECARCSGRGQSRLEFEVAEILRMTTREHVELDTPVRAGGRSWRIDLTIPRIELLVDLDPERWHADHERDQRKVVALHEHRYIRVRPESLPQLAGATTAAVPNKCADAYEWASALRVACESFGLTWNELDLADRGLALAAATGRWRETLSGRPMRSAIDVAPHLEREFEKNLTRPNISPSWLSPSAKDLCQWRCGACGERWTTSVASRAGAGTNCPSCARAATAARFRTRSFPALGCSLADLHPTIAAELVECIPQPERHASDLLPASNLKCGWRCAACGHQYEGTVAARTRGRGCPNCAPAKAGTARSTVAYDASLEALHPVLAAELVDIPGRPERSARDISPGSNYVGRWRCSSCGHEWTTTFASRALGGTGCSACLHQRIGRLRATPAPGRSLQDLHPNVAAEFRENLTHPGRSPEEITVASHDRCRFECERGHQWISVVKNRTRQGSNCPECYALKRTTER